MFFALTFNSPPFGPPRSGLYVRYVYSDTETLLVSGSFGCGEFSGDGVLYAYTTEAGEVVVVNTRTGQSRVVATQDALKLDFSDDHRYLFYDSLSQLYRYDSTTTSEGTVALTDRVLAARVRR